MGCSVNARCACGYTALDLPVGGGMFTFEVLCLFPVFCPACRAVSVANLYAGLPAAAQGAPEPGPPRCQRCQSPEVTPYDSAKLVKERGARTVASWSSTGRLGRSLRLSDGRYLCPSCGEFALTFEAGETMWD